MTYTPPSVQVSSIANSRIINISENARVPAVVGTGPATRSISDYPISRGSADYDLLPTSGSVVTISKVAAYPGASATDTRWTGPVDHFNTSGSTGAIYWATTETPGEGKPLLGETYYLSYTYPVPASQYQPQTFTDTKDIAAFYGSEETGIKPDITTGSGSIVTGANLALENGAPAVVCLQLSNGADPSSSSTWTAAFTQLKRVDNIAYLVPLASGSTGKLAAHSAAILHVNSESAPAIGHEHSCILGASAGQSVSSIITSTTALADRRAIFIVPGKEITRTLASGTVLTLDGAWAGAALAGLLTGQSKAVTPVTGKVLTGISIPDYQYSEYEMNYMANNGACILYSRSGVIKIRHALTTDPTNADTQEISVVAADDYVRRVTRTKMTQRFVGKGIVIDDATIAAVEATLRTIWSAMQRDGYIAGFGSRTDPTTGEVPISAARNSADPTRIDITGSIQFLYPLNYITVEFFIYV